MSENDDATTEDLDLADPPPRGARGQRQSHGLRTLDKSIIAIPLLDDIRAEVRKRTRAASAGKRAPRRRAYDVIIDLNLKFGGGRIRAKDQVFDLIKQLEDEGHIARIAKLKTDLSDQYVFAELDGEAIQKLVRRDNPHRDEPIELRSSAGSPMGGEPQAPPAEAKHTTERAIYRVWPDFPLQPHIVKSLSTVKADAAHSAFGAVGSDIVWAVVDSGIDGTHRHFKRHANLELTAPLSHFDFSVPDGTPESALTDVAGHGTHVAGIITGEVTASWKAEGDPDDRPIAMTRHWDERGGLTYVKDRLGAISGIAPRCKVVSFKVLDNKGKGLASNIMAAIAQIQELNGFGRHMMIHGVNLSVGYEFEPEWFACGQSPLCVEVDRLVRSGVVVVVSSGNTGYGFQTTKYEGTVSAGMDLSINDPGNAELAITVGSTHREMPHTYGVSYFSSKGPTGDGRLKPDVVAPGEKVISCAAGTPRDKARAQSGAECEYVEQSGTSMAAPHVSGVIAAFLSVRREFIGQPEAVKSIFVSTATDLKRDRYFQGSGLVDLMRAIQSV
jgi:serine protease AprX